jgi:hypothetical protein
MVFQHLSHSLSQVLRQVETICNLHGVRSATCRAIGVGTTSIPTDNLDPRSVVQPGSQGIGRPIWQQVNNLVLLQIDQDGPIGVALPLRPVVDPKRPWRGRLDHGRTADQAEQGGWTGRHPKTTNNPGSGLATQGEGQEAHHLGKTNGAASIGGHHCGQPFGEDPTRAGRLAAEELAGTKLETDRLTAPREVSDGPPVQAVDRLGPDAADGTRRSGCDGFNCGDDLARSD